MTSIPELKEKIMLIYPLFLLNQIPDVFRSMLRGPCKGLNLLGKMTIYCLINQIGLSPVYLYFFTFFLDFKLHGIWIAKMIIDSTIGLCLCWILIRADWNQISLDSIKRQLNEKKTSTIGTLQNQRSK